MPACQFVIIGTKAVQEPGFINDLCAEYPGHIIVGLGRKDGRVALWLVEAVKHT